MTPFFSPGPNPWGPPKVYLAAVGEHMTRVAGEVCDGINPALLHHAALSAGAPAIEVLRSA
jgi:alkanesulfonate monooxygenase SsuD/methylene tetrahydromethanopterin reductase-like flavin-dependent oxidoreductase (luciferase family)